MKRMTYQIFVDTGVVPQHRNVGYMPIVDGAPVSWKPRKQEADTFWMTQAEEEKVAVIDAAMWLHHLFGKIFPPLYINK